MDESWGLKITKAMIDKATELKIAGAAMVCLEDIPPTHGSACYYSLAVTADGRVIVDNELWRSGDPGIFCLRRYHTNTFLMVCEMQRSGKFTGNHTESHYPTGGLLGNVHQSLCFYVAFDGGTPEQNLSVSEAGARAFRDKA